MLMAAGSYWDRQGVPSVCPTTLELVDDPGHGRAVAGLGGGVGCRVELSREFVRSHFAVMRVDPRRAMRRDFAADVFLLVVHEEGHVRGLAHTESGIMAEGGPWGSPVPEEGMRVVRRLIRRR